MPVLFTEPSNTCACFGKYMRMFFRNVLHVFQKHVDVFGKRLDVFLGRGIWGCKTKDFGKEGFRIQPDGRGTRRASSSNIPLVLLQKERAAL